MPSETSSEESMEEASQIMVPQFPSIEGRASNTDAGWQMVGVNRSNSKSGPSAIIRKPVLETTTSIGKENEMFKEIMKEIHALKYEVGSLKGMIKDRQSFSHCCGKGEEIQCLTTIMPVGNEEEIIALCNELKDEGLRKQLIQEL